MNVNLRKVIVLPLSCCRMPAYLTTFQNFQSVPPKILILIPMCSHLRELWLWYGVSLDWSQILHPVPPWFILDICDLKLEQPEFYSFLVD